MSPSGKPRRAVNSGRPIWTIQARNQWRSIRPLNASLNYRVWNIRRPALPLDPTQPRFAPGHEIGGAVSYSWQGASGRWYEFDVAKAKRAWDHAGGIYMFVKPSECATGEWGGPICLFVAKTHD